MCAWEEEMGKMNAGLGRGHCHLPQGLASLWGQGMDSSQKAGWRTGWTRAIAGPQRLYTKPHPIPSRPWLMSLFEGQIHS